MTEGDTNRTPEEREIIEKVAERRGQEWAEHYAELILAQARAIGDLSAEAESLRDGYEK